MEKRKTKGRLSGAPKDDTTTIRGSGSSRQAHWRERWTREVATNQSLRGQQAHSAPSTREALADEEETKAAEEKGHAKQLLKDAKQAV